MSRQRWIHKMIGGPSFGAASRGVDSATMETFRNRKLNTGNFGGFILLVSSSTDMYLLKEYLNLGNELSKALK